MKKNHSKIIVSLLSILLTGVVLYSLSFFIFSKEKLLLSCHGNVPDKYCISYIIDRRLFGKENYFFITKYETDIYGEYVGDTDHINSIPGDFKDKVNIDWSEDPEGVRITTYQGREIFITKSDYSGGR